MRELQTVSAITASYEKETIQNKTFGVKIQNWTLCKVRLALYICSWLAIPQGVVFSKAEHESFAAFFMCVQ